MVKNVDWWAAASPLYQAADYVVGVRVRNPSGLYGACDIHFGQVEDWQFHTIEMDPDGYCGIWRSSFVRLASNIRKVSIEKCLSLHLMPPSAHKVTAGIFSPPRFGNLMCYYGNTCWLMTVLKD